MTIYGLSQTTGIERTLEVDSIPSGVRLQSRGRTSVDTIVVASDPLLAALIDRPAERTTIPSVAAEGESAKSLDMIVRGNEVMLWIKAEAGPSWDIAVGFDDFQDALEEASAAG